MLSDKANEIALVKKAKFDPKNTSESKNESIKNTPARKPAGERFVLEIFNVFFNYCVVRSPFFVNPVHFCGYRIRAALSCVFRAVDRCPRD